MIQELIKAIMCSRFEGSIQIAIDKKSNGYKKYKKSNKLDVTVVNLSALKCIVNALTCRYSAIKIVIVVDAVTNNRQTIIKKLFLMR